MKVFVTRKIPEKGIEILKNAGLDVEVWEDELPPPREVLMEKVKDLDALLSLLTEK